MARKGFGRIYEHTKGKFVLYLPAAVVKDSAFPFRKGNRVVVEIRVGGLVVRKASK
jgi:hypothetical protein